MNNKLTLFIMGGGEKYPPEPPRWGCSMTVQVGDSEIAKVMMGNDIVWQPMDYGSVWFRCQQTIGYNTFMQFDPATNIAYFVDDNRSGRSIPPYSPAKSTLVLQLPKGFRFGSGNPDTVPMSQSSGDFTATYEEDKLYVIFGNNSQNDYPTRISARLFADLKIEGYAFNVIKED